eukprot:gene32886-42564_t
MFEKVVQNIITSTSSAPQDPLPIILEPNNNFLSQLGYLASEIAANPITIPLFTAITTAFVIAGVGYDDSKVGNPYDGLVAPRMLRLVFLTAAFNWNLLIDWRTGNLAKNEKIRAKEALELCTKLGPTFIKLGQALSIRTDLLNEAYANELQKLQDAVPPFNSTYAKEIICKELGIQKLDEKFKFVSEKPLAAASIGQVYRGTLYDGRDVAIKVQRPKILDAIAVDLYLLRLITPLQVRVTNFAQGIVADQFDIDGGLAFVDEWGRGLVSEADYCMEANNAKSFLRAMESRGLTALTAPQVVDEASGPRVLVTTWINGTRLDASTSPDVPRLCAVAVNAYLTMLLDTGVLHCDPHPGNLLRTTDGKLCILDWGMTISVPPDLQYGLLEFIAHMNAEDYDALPEDFVKIGATPPDRIDDVRRSGMAEGFAFAMKQLSKGGGPAKIRDRLREEYQKKYGNISDEELSMKAKDEMMSNLESQLRSEGVDVVSGVTNVMETLSKRNREFFKLPTYMLYVSRAFSVLEGIGLSVDENYSILQECYPYMAKRLMTDDSPRSRKALRDMLVSGNGLIASDKLFEFSSGFQNYTASTVSLSTESEKDGDGMKAAQLALIDLLLDKKGNLMQELLVEGAANITDSLIRDSIERAYMSPTGQFLQMALRVPKTLVQAVVPERLQMLALPITWPYDLSIALYKLSEKDELDVASLESLRSVWNSVVEPRLRESLNDLLAGDPSAQPKVNDVLETLREANLGQRAPAAVNLGRKLTATLLSRAASRLQYTATKVRKHETLMAQSGPRSSALHAATAAAAAAVAAAAVGDDIDGEVLGDGNASLATTTSTTTTEIVRKQSVEQAFNVTVVSSSPSQPPTSGVELDDLEILLTKRLGSLSANTANRLANIINDG